MVKGERCKSEKGKRGNPEPSPRTRPAWYKGKCASWVVQSQDWNVQSKNSNLKGTRCKVKGERGERSSAKVRGERVKRGELTDGSCAKRVKLNIYIYIYTCSLLHHIIYSQNLRTYGCPSTALILPLPRPRLGERSPWKSRPGTRPGVPGSMTGCVESQQ